MCLIKPQGTYSRKAYDGDDQIIIINLSQGLTLNIPTNKH